MVTAIRQKAVVGKDGKIELLQTELKEGTAVEVIVLPEETPTENVPHALHQKSSVLHLGENEVDAIAVQAVRQVRANQ
jgi:antitoxin YefM